MECGVCSDWLDLLFTPPPPIVCELIIFCRGFFLLGVLGMMMGLFKICSATRPYNYMIGASFFIYASHRIVCWKLAGVWRYVSTYEGLMHLPFGGMALALVEFFLTMGLSILVYKMVNTYLPCLGRVLSRH